jgi:hypothetical protein
LTTRIIGAPATGGTGEGFDGDDPEPDGDDGADVGAEEAVDDDAGLLAAGVVALPQADSMAVASAAAARVITEILMLMTSSRRVSRQLSVHFGASRGLDAATTGRGSTKAGIDGQGHPGRDGGQASLA